ncbi:probable 2-oxoglutarate-dependent dioxygenase SLC1 isoform X2 [Cryptomeria japonica]|uniref:probable 2-oxoglutarate-dependent dioxygenase SLC1 isoform X2 n=1 Tax=Cryptomeria japonica TaxID=3369 RepID=UPI0027DA48A8|nr:probable 2-oxoglutarate-dependent dioxygenase SLC1 isoform X2 [Cryptomeria japonica]
MTKLQRSHMGSVNCQKISVGEEEIDKNFWQSVKSLSEQKIERLPTKYILPPSQRPKLNEIFAQQTYDLPVIDLSGLQGDRRSEVVKAIGNAAAQKGFFQVVNHGIPEMVVEEMLKVSSEYFEVPLEERQKFMSTDVRKPIRYGTSWNQLNDTCFCWRDFLKHYCHPLDEMVHMWPSNPPQYRCVVACYSEQVKLLATELMAAMMEHLEIKSTSIQKTFKNGSQMMVLNCYPPCPQPNLTLGMLPHSDYGCITILLQDEVEGLQVQDEGLWKSVRPLPGSFLINIGDHLEVLSNGRFKSAIHRVVVNSERSRVSVATVHSLPFHVKISPCPELIDEHHPKMYRDTNFNDFLNSLTCSRFNGIRFLDSIKLYTT